MTSDFSFFKSHTPQIIGESRAHAAAVCIPLLEGPNGTELLFERRSEKIDQQPGDICFPGGAIEAGETPQQAAIREMTEELLVSPDQIELLGPADLLAADHVRISSFVCRLHGYDGRFSPQEVSEVFRVPLAFFLAARPEVHTIRWTPQFGEDFPFEKIYGGRAYQWLPRTYTVLFYEYDGRVIWGLTAKLVNAFAEICREAGLKP